MPLAALAAPGRVLLACSQLAWLIVSSPPPIPRNLWREVTRYLRLGDIDAATEQKRHLEERQRVEERKRENLRTPWKPKYFIQEVTLLSVIGPLPRRELVLRG